MILVVWACATPPPLDPSPAVPIPASPPPFTVAVPITPTATWSDASWRTFEQTGVPPPGAAPLPEPYAAWAEGRVALASGDLTTAAERFHQVGPPLDRTARVWVARVDRDAGRTEAATTAWKALIEVADPAPGNAEALGALAAQSPAGGAEARSYHSRVWRHYPHTPEDTAAIAALGPVTDPVAATARAQALSELGLWAEVTSLLTPLEDQVAAAGDPVGEGRCRFYYPLGRAWYKLGKRPEADAALAPTAAACATTPEVAVDALYLHARLAAWRGQDRTAAARFTEVARRFPDHRYADDGLVLAGKHLASAGDRVAARAAWTEAITRFPDGDLIPEAEFLAGRGAWLDGDLPGALGLLDHLAARDPSEDRFHVPGGRYWAARIRMSPSVADDRPPIDAGAAIDGWTQLFTDLPWTYYGLLASMRLAEVAPERLAAVPSRPDPTPERWVVPTDWWTSPDVERARSLLAVGLVGPAREAWTQAPGAPTGAAMAWWTESRAAAGDPVSAHADLRVWLRTHVPPTPGPDAVALLSVAYPDLWWPEVQIATAGDRTDPRLFQALVRTESNFDPAAVSWAGARGLSQVMPQTGARVGAWSGETVTAVDLLDPTINLTIGAAYLDYLHGFLGGSPFLAAAGYNAGEHRVETWWDETIGPLPTDEFVERIPFDETRMYVKRVLGTYQAYRWLDGARGAPDGLVAYTHRAWPDR